MEIKKSSQYPRAKNLNKKWQKFDTRQKKKRPNIWLRSRNKIKTFEQKK